MIRSFLSVFFILIFLVGAYSQQKFTVSGHVTDGETGEELIGVQITVDEMSGTGTVTNLYGFYSLTLPEGTYHLSYNYLGYDLISREITLSGDLKLDVELKTKAQELEAVEITGEKKTKNVEQVEMSKMDMKIETIKNIPALFGEVDVIKAIQLLPGVQTSGEGTSGMYVRGGGADQNLVLLDEAPVYNASHLMGFFSVFNSDAIKDVQFYKGGVPAEYGGRLSSILDIRMNDGNSKKLGLTGGVGTVSSRLTIDGPIIKDKSSFILSGRRTYADQFLRFSSNEEIKNNTLYFYDFNGKVNYRINDKNRLFLSGYAGRDVFKFREAFGINWGNITGTVRWNHLFSDKLFSNFTVIYSNFDYFLGAANGSNMDFSWRSNIADLNFKGDLNYYLNPNNTLKFGVNTIYHRFNPGIAKGEGDASIYNEIKVPESFAFEHAIYASNEQKLGVRWNVNYGLRFTLFQNIGKGTVYQFDDQYNATGVTEYEDDLFNVYNSYSGFEPRIGIRYLLSTNSSLKASYTRMNQYLHLASNSSSISPLDVWIPSSPNLKPQIADQVAMGYFRNFKNNTYEASVEAYYKEMQNQIDFRDNAEIFLNPKLEGEMRVGDATAYGLEFFLKKQTGSFTGWVSYTLAKVQRTIPEINNGKPYSPLYDRRHDASVVLTYQISKRLSASANWVYATGAAVTMPSAKYTYRNSTIIPFYVQRNGDRLPAYHRLDLGVKLDGKETRKWKGSWVFSVYNAYYRKNAYLISFRPKPENPNQAEAYKLYLFAIVPAVTYNFKF